MKKFLIKLVEKYLKVKCIENYKPVTLPDTVEVDATVVWRLKHRAWDFTHSEEMQARKDIAKDIGIGLLSKGLIKFNITGQGRYVRLEGKVEAVRK